MRSVNLLKVAFDAELLRLRAMMARQGRRAAFAVVALIFALAVLALTEVLGWLALRLRLESIPATAILLGINLVVAAIFGVLAARSSPGHTEQEALRVRRQGPRRGAGHAGAHRGRPCRETPVGEWRNGRDWRIPFMG